MGQWCVMHDCVLGDVVLSPNWGLHPIGGDKNTVCVRLTAVYTSEQFSTTSNNTVRLSAAEAVRESADVAFLCAAFPSPLQNSTGRVPTQTQPKRRDGKRLQETQRPNSPVSRS
eukprot:scaffold700_cov158-Pinguiococcus_pyrenoidosus.AAC.2